jgi:outer membrane protein
MKQSLKILILLLIFSFEMQAQKFGYINTQELLAEMEELKVADIQVAALQDEMLVKGESMVKKFEEEYKVFMEEANNGLLSKVQMQQKEEALVAKQEELRNYELEIQKKVAEKREELYKPVLDKVKAEIEMLGKEGGYTMIFDSSAGMILHAADTENLMPLIKARLNKE